MQMEFYDPTFALFNVNHQHSSLNDPNHFKKVLILFLGPEKIQISKRCPRGTALLQRENPHQHKNNPKQLRDQDPTDVFSGAQDLSRVLCQLRSKRQTGDDRHTGRASCAHGAHQGRY